MEKTTAAMFGEVRCKTLLTGYLASLACRGRLLSVGRVYAQICDLDLDILETESVPQSALQTGHGHM